MVYTINKGPESEQWRKYVAGFAALFISVTMPVLSALMFNTSDAPGNGVKGVSSVNKPSDDSKRPADTSKNTPAANNSPTNQPANTGNAAQPGSTTGDVATAGASVMPYIAPAAGAAVPSNSGTIYAASGTATSGGGRGGTTAAPATNDTAQPSDCGCSDGTDTNPPISVDLLNIVELQLDPTSPTASSLNLGL